MPFMKIVRGNVNKGKIILFDTVEDDAIIEDINGNRYLREDVEPLSEEEEKKYLQVEDVDLGL